MTSTRKVTLKDMRNLFLVRDRVIWYPDLNTDTMACPIGVRINRVRLNMNFFKVTFRPSKRLKLIGRWFPESSTDFYSVLSRENNGTLCCLYVSLIRELKQRRRRRQRERQKSNSFRLEKQKHCRCITLFCTFRSRRCTTTT